MDQNINVVRGYEVLPDSSIRFGIRIENKGQTALSDVEIILDYSDNLFNLEGERIQRLGTLPPGATRTAKFNLKPLSCIHNETVGGSLLYKDSEWRKHMESIRNKEIHCVCPFLKGKPMKSSEFIGLVSKGFSIEKGMNFKGVSSDKLVSFLTQTCKNRLYKVDDHSIDGERILNFAAESVGEKIIYLLTVVIKENADLTQVFFQATSDEEHGLHGFLNEITNDLKHLVSTLQSAQEIGVIKKEQVINIIDSVVQRSNFNDSDSTTHIKNPTASQYSHGNSEKVNEAYESTKKPVVGEIAAEDTSSSTTGKVNTASNSSNVKSETKNNGSKSPVPKKNKKGIRKSSIVLAIVVIFIAALAAAVIFQPSDDLQQEALQYEVQSTSEPAQEVREYVVVKNIEGIRATSSYNDISDTIDLIRLKVGLDVGSAPVDFNQVVVSITDGTTANTLVYVGNEEFYATANDYSGSMDSFSTDASTNLQTLLTGTTITNTKFSNSANYYTVERIRDEDGSFSQANPVMNTGDLITVYVATTSDAAASKGYNKVSSIDTSSGLKSSGLDLVPRSTVNIVITPESGKATTADFVTPSSYGVKETVQLYP